MLKKRKEEEAGESLRLERNSYQRARAQAIVNNPGFSLDPVEDEQPAEENNDTRTEIKEDVGNNDIGTNDQDGSTPTGVAVAREEVITPPEVSEGDDNGTPDQTTNSNIQDDDVEHNERDRETVDEESLSGRSKLESAQEQVLNSGEAKEQTDTEQDTGGSSGEIPEQEATDLIVDKKAYNPYTDDRPDEELTKIQLSARHDMKLYSPSGVLVSNRGKAIKKVTIKSKEDKNTQ